MLDQQVIRIGSIVWAVVGFTVAVRSIGAVNADARGFVLTACVVGSASALVDVDSGAADRARTIALLPNARR